MGPNFTPRSGAGQRSLVALAQGTHSGYCRGRGPFLVLLFFALECRVLDVLFPLFRPGARLTLVHFSNSVEPLSLFLLLSIILAFISRSSNHSTTTPLDFLQE